MSLSISPETLQKDIKSGKDMIIADVRDKDDYVAGHIDGAVNWPMESLGTHLDAHSPDSFIIFTCKSGQRSLQACNFAKMLGYKNTKSLTGGFMAWPK